METNAAAQRRMTKTLAFLGSMMVIALLLAPTVGARLLVAAYLLSIPAFATVVYFLMPHRFRRRGTAFHLRLSGRPQAGLNSFVMSLAVWAIIFGYFFGYESAIASIITYSIVLLITYARNLKVSSKQERESLSKTLEFSFIGVSGELMAEAIFAENFQREFPHDEIPVSSAAKIDEVNFLMLTGRHRFRWLFADHAVQRIKLQVNSSFHGEKTLQIVNRLKKRLEKMSTAKGFSVDPEMEFYGKRIDSSRAILIALFFSFVVAKFGLHFST